MFSFFCKLFGGKPIVNSRVVSVNKVDNTIRGEFKWVVQLSCVRSEFEIVLENNKLEGVTINCPCCRKALKLPAPPKYEERKVGSVDWNSHKVILTKIDYQNGHTARVVKVLHYVEFKE